MNALIGPDAGFHKARFRRESITLERKRWLGKARLYWNRRAGWKLFVWAPKGTVADITAKLDPRCGACAQLPPPHDWTAPYTSANVSLYRQYRDLSTVVHELGHCLGLRHQKRGAMSQGDKLDKAFERKLLTGAGYR